MSMTIDNKTFRNLEEQVLKNKEDIAQHYEVERVLADWGIKVIGVVATINDIPEGDYEYGDSYGLSSTSPMQYVIWTRANPNVGQDSDYWLNVGALSLVGPQGAQGIQGIQGVRGERGSKWTSSTSAPTATSGYNMGDQWLNTTTGDVYEFRGNTWARLGNIKGPQGVQGPIGPKGDQGIQGPTGAQGPKGDTGSSFTIAGLLNSAENLPTPTEANRHKGYAVKNVDNVTYDLYVVVGEAGSLQWVNMGRVEGVEGPQGPVGPQGPAGADIQIVHITGIPSTATQGNLTQDQVNTLLAHPGNYIQFFNENFYPQDVEIGEGYIVYSHVGQIGNETKIKNINLTIATGGWVLTETSLVSAPISVVNELPEANEENFEKGKIYTTGELLQYLAKVPLAEPNISQANSLTQAVSFSSAAAVGTDIYIFGGSYGGNEVKTIYKYSTTTNVITTMSSTLPQALSHTSAAVVGTDIYIFGGIGSNGAVKTIYKYSTTTNVITTMSSTLPQTSFGTSAAAVGTDIYIFGGYTPSASNTIYKYSTTTNVITTMSSTLPQAVAYTSAAAVGTYIYIFGGYGNTNKSIYKYSTTTNVISTMSSTLPEALESTSAAVVGTDIYIFGGKNNVSQLVNTIYKYSTTTNVITTMSSTLPQALYRTSAAVVGTDIYIFGGYGSNGDVNTIYEVAFGYNFQYKTIATE